MLISRHWHVPLQLGDLETFWYPQSVLEGLCEPWFSPCFDGDDLRAAQKSLLLFVLQYVPGRFGDALDSEIRFNAPSGFWHGLDLPHDVLARYMQTLALFLSRQARSFAAFLLLSRLHPLVPPFLFCSARYCYPCMCS